MLLGRETIQFLGSNVASGVLTADLFIIVRYYDGNWHIVNPIFVAAAATVALSAGNIPDLPASKITSGQFSTARIPNHSANKVNSGTLGTARIPNLSANKITSATLGVDRIPNLNASKINAGTLNAARVAVEISQSDYDALTTPVATTIYAITS